MTGRWGEGGGSQVVYHAPKYEGGRGEGSKNFAVKKPKMRTEGGYGVISGALFFLRLVLNGEGRNGQCPKFAELSACWVIVHCCAKREGKVWNSTNAPVINHQVCRGIFFLVAWTFSCRLGV